ncbi:MAG: putative Thymus-specific serine protease [Streblomastix strix]|uniref:Putative Thymus-specific serine protease n=1 Tax=Streblomastix strix TaxID=222440 RepID=A0A5J4WXI0_9EUKA|nr:MAG: putative Thymus-specific serine protease [Streblomastix strix]
MLVRLLVLLPIINLIVGAKSSKFKNFQQNLDHFESNTKQLFNQRYIINSKYYNGSHNMLFVLGGKGGIAPDLVDKGHVVELAQKIGAVIVGLEHRFYGQSRPYDTTTSDHLQFLTSKQAVADAGRFIEWIINTELKKCTIRRTITVGGGYGGSLSAWVRARYPHLVIGSIASSAPLLAKQDFWEYDQVVVQAIGDECFNDLKTGMNEAVNWIYNYIDQIRKKLKCGSTMNAVDIIYVLADAVSIAIQNNQENGTSKYQTRKNLCDIMTAEVGKERTKADLLLTFIEQLFDNMSTSCYNISLMDERLKREQDQYVNGDREWLYQQCSEFGFFQIALPQGQEGHQLRDMSINDQFYQTQCGLIFFPQPQLNINATNIYFGGVDNFKGTNIAFVNGELDPWNRLSIQYDNIEKDALKQHNISLSPKDDRLRLQHWTVLQVANGSHSNDLWETTASDSESLNATRKYVDETVMNWIEAASLLEEERLHDKNSNISFNSPLFIVAVIVFVFSVIILIIGAIFISRRWANRKQYSQIEAPLLGDQQTSRR